MVATLAKEEKNMEMSPACSLVCPGFRWAVLSVLLLSGFCSCLHHYHFIQKSETWHEARTYCRKRYSDLATIDNTEDMERLLTAAGNYTGTVWIGLYDSPPAWSWVLAGLNLYGRNERDFRRWDTGSPNKVDPHSMLCAAFWKGVWKDHLCKEKQSFVCYNRTLLDLPPTSIDRYFFISAKTTWSEAKDYCKQHHTNLASVRNETENTQIQQVVPDGQLAWLGLYRKSWCYWSDESQSNFKNWAVGHPSDVNKSCAVSVINATDPGKWEERACDRKFHFMCHNKKVQVFHMKLRALKSTIDLSDRAVTDAILNVLESKIKEKGFPKDFKMSWIKKPDEDIFHREKETVDPVKTDFNLAACFLKKV